MPLLSVARTRLPPIQFGNAGLARKPPPAPDAAPAERPIPGADSILSGRCAKFSGRSSPAGAERSLSRSRERAGVRARFPSSGPSGHLLPQAGEGTSCPGADSIFSRRCAGFSGRSAPAGAERSLSRSRERAGVRARFPSSGPSGHLLPQAGEGTSCSGADLTFSRPCGGFSGRSSRARVAERPFSLPGLTRGSRGES